jgi:hypothetical protein
VLDATDATTICGIVKFTTAATLGAETEPTAAKQAEATGKKGKK